MKAFTDIINESSQDTIEKTISVKWTADLRGVIKALNDEADKYAESLEDRVFLDIQNWYKNTPRKQKTKLSGCISTQTAVDLNDPVIKKLYNLFQEIGMGLALEWFGKRHFGNSYSVTGDSWYRDYKDQKDKINWDSKSFNNDEEKELRLPGNGYNNLSGDIISTWRDKLCDAISKTKIIIRNPDSSNITIVAYPVWDKNKIKKIYDEVLADESLMKFRDGLQRTGKSISKYYEESPRGTQFGD